jgi:HNH endonuclease
MPLVKVRNRPQMVLWEPTTALLCTYCREPFRVVRETLGQVNFCFDFVVPDPLQRGEYWYLHKRCAHIEDALDVQWGWHGLGWVLGVDRGMQRGFGSLQKHLRKTMPQGCYETLLQAWLPAMHPAKALKSLRPQHTKREVHPQAVPHPLMVKQRRSSPREPRNFSPSLRFRILQRDGFRCRLCGLARNDSPDVRLEVDHIVPRSRGGSNDPANLQTLCFACNRGKHARLL